MDTIPNFFFLFLSLTLQPYQVLAMNDETGVDLITQTCEHSVYKDLCIESLKSDPRSQKSDLKALALIMINAVAGNATNMSYYISKLLNKTTDSFIQQCLNDCSENYMDAIDQLEDSLGALDSEGYSDIEALVQAAMSNAESCENGFKDQSGHKSMLTDGNVVFKQLCSNVLAITNLLAGI